jgi:hypothetical protein
MGLRLIRTARRAGVEALPLLQRAHALAMEPRHRLLDDDHDPRYLHPGRTALVCLTDGEMRDPVALAASLLVDTVSPELAPVPDALSRIHASHELHEAFSLRDRIPRPFGEGLAEALITTEPEVRVLALAEWLDQLRHLRLWAAGPAVSSAQRVTEEVYLPVAERTHTTLARRFRWWVRRVGPGLNASS